MAEEKIRHIVRIANTDLKGSSPIIVALTKIKGIGFMFSNAICKTAGVSRTTKAGLLTDAQISKLDEV